MKINFDKLLKGALTAAALYAANKEQIDGVVRQIGRTLGTNKPPKKVSEK